MTFPICDKYQNLMNLLFHTELSPQLSHFNHPNKHSILNTTAVLPQTWKIREFLFKKIKVRGKSDLKIKFLVSLDFLKV